MSYLTYNYHLQECQPDLLIVLMYTWYSWHALAHSCNLIIT